MSTSPLPGDWPRTIYICPACGKTLAPAVNGWIPTCPSLNHDAVRGVPVDVVPVHEAEFRPDDDPRERPGWSQMSDGEREHEMAEYLSRQAGADV